MLGLRAHCCNLMNEALARTGVQKQELARRLNVSRPYVSKILNEAENLTLDQIDRVLEALGFELVVKLRKKK